MTLREDLTLRIDWFSIITELQAGRVSLAEQARWCGVAEGTISYWKAGGEPKHCYGALLIDLFVATFPDKPRPQKILRNLRAT